MNEFQCAGMAFLQIDTGNTAVVNLSEELAEVSAPLMPYPCIREEARLIACLDNAIGEVDVLAEAHLRKTTQLQIDVAADAHVERAGVELVELCLAATDASGGEEGGHRVADGFLHGSERRMRRIGTAEGN